jgi:hypothetical protein
LHVRALDCIRCPTQGLPHGHTAWSFRYSSRADSFSASSTSSRSPA